MPPPPVWGRSEQGADCQSGEKSRYRSELVLGDTNNTTMYRDTKSSRYTFVDTTRMAGPFNTLLCDEPEFANV